MTNQEARGILENLEADYRDLDPLVLTDDSIRLVNKRIEALGAAISALQVQDFPYINVGDMISREAAIYAAIEAVDEWDGGCNLTRADMIADAINNAVPPIQPEPSQVARDIATIIENEQDMRVIERNDIVRCKDCKHNPKDEWFGCPMSHLNEKQRPETAWCWKGERRTDECTD